MSKEFHVFTHQDPNFEQAFVFEVERHMDDHLIEFKDLLMITTTEHGELRTRIRFEDMIQSVIHTHGGNIENSNIRVIVDMFKDLIPQEKQTEILDEAIFTDKPVVAAPATSKGVSGNKAGMVAYSSGYFYYCTTDYTDGAADIWVRSAWDQTSWS